MGKSFCSAGAYIFQGHYSFRNRDRMQNLALLMNQSWKDAWWVVYMPMQMCPVSDYNRISGITNSTFPVVLHSPAAALAQFSLLVLAAAAEGAELCQQLLTGIAAWAESRTQSKFCSWDVGTQRGVLWALCLSLESTYTDICKSSRILPRDTWCPFLLLEKEV